MCGLIHLFKRDKIHVLLPLFSRFVRVAEFVIPVPYPHLSLFSLARLSPIVLFYRRTDCHHCVSFWLFFSLIKVAGYYWDSFSSIFGKINKNKVTRHWAWRVLRLNSPSVMAFSRVNFARLNSPFGMAFSRVEYAIGHGVFSGFSSPFSMAFSRD